VVDDEQGVRDFARIVLERLGYQVDLACDGVEALDKLEVDPEGFDVVLLDLSMPRMGGMETLHHIRGQFDDLPVVLSSGYNEDDSFDRGAGSSPTQFLKKPYRAEDLEDVIRMVGIKTATMPQ
jgi:CheY-like chemotaxis protein